MAADTLKTSLTQRMNQAAYRVLQVRLTTCVAAALCVFIIIRFFSCYGEYNFAHIPPEDIPRELYRETVPNLVKKASIDCTYDDILASTYTIEPWQVPDKFDDFLPTGIVNGSYVPEHCNPAFSVAILVTYRDRQKQLDVFLPYIHNFLRKQNIHYKIFLIELVNDKPWNKGLLYNLGAKLALAEQFPCLVLHDVDMLPLDAANLYACTRQPRHLSGSLDKHRFVLVYSTLVGGVLALRGEQYVQVGGFSNRFQGWGGEDDDMAARIQAHGLTIQRFPRSMSRYSMLRHAAAAKNPERRRILAQNRLDRAADGLAHVWYDSLQVQHHRLFTWLRVKL